MAILPQKVEIVEVSPRDGIQNEKVILSTEAKLELVNQAIAAGAERIEVTSFVNPSRVPQMADADALSRALPRGKARYIGLVLNQRGCHRALASGLDELNYVIVASNSFSERNQGMTTQDGITNWSAIAKETKGQMQASLTIAAAFGCPFEGEVPVSRLLTVVEEAMAEPAQELTLADTIGVASPRDVTERVEAIREKFPDLKIRLHLHNTRNTGFANAWAGVLSGVTSFDASIGGLGGCPFAPNATGNIATEDLAYMMHRSGIATGYDIEACIKTAGWLEGQLGHSVPGLLGKAGNFPMSNEAA